VGLGAAPNKATLVLPGVGDLGVTVLAPQRFRGRFEEFLAALEDVVAAGGLALLTEPASHYGAVPRSPAFRDVARFGELADGIYEWSLVETLTDCAAVPLPRPGISRGVLTATVRPPVAGSSPLVLGRKAAVRQLWLAGSSLGTQPRLVESAELSRDPMLFGEILRSRPEFFNVAAWTAKHAGDYFGTLRRAFVHGIGQRMADHHERWIFDLDAHEDNFVFSDELLPDRVRRRVVRVDLQHTHLLYRPLTPVQAATTLLPLLSSFSREDWSWFCEGYASVRGDAALLTLDVIDYGIR
jgi:hypothetical protein